MTDRRGQFRPFTANCSADQVGGRRPVPMPYHCDWFGANTTFDFFVQTQARGQLHATVHMHTQWTNATIGVQLGAGPEVIVKCPITPTAPEGVSYWSQCDAALLVVTEPGVDVVRLRSIGWAPNFRTYAIANVTFTMAQ